MLLLAFRSFFFIAVILGYSTGLWRLINDYFRREFQSYLEEQAQTNKYLLEDPTYRKSNEPQGTIPTNFATLKKVILFGDSGEVDTIKSNDKGHFRNGRSLVTSSLSVPINNVEMLMHSKDITNEKINSESSETKFVSEEILMHSKDITNEKINSASIVMKIVSEEIENHLQGMAAIVTVVAPENVIDIKSLMDETMNEYNRKMIKETMEKKTQEHNMQKNEKKEQKDESREQIEDTWISYWSNRDRPHGNGKSYSESNDFSCVSLDLQNNDQKSSPVDLVIEDEEGPMQGDRAEMLLRCGSENHL
ncbi:uncharacterized protein LOC128729311 [Anopheles nili]|uniref:uncharacterized protein LOC128729311 n=1 Tax=Anopheles nili TaxID=185578 RepID=UPI00237A3461|nr:uncharacterized protein LOC128729311 [Anopheles nili]